MVRTRSCTILRTETSSERSIGGTAIHHTHTARFRPVASHIDANAATMLLYLMVCRLSFVCYVAVSSKQFGATTHDPRGTYHPAQ